MNRIRLFLFAALLCAPFMLRAQSDAMPFIRIDRNPKTFAMAASGAASSSGMAWASFRNAAVIPFCSDTVDAAFSYQHWAPDGDPAHHANFGVGVRMDEKFGFSVGGAYGKGSTPGDYLASAGVGYRFTERLGGGVNLRYAGQKLTEDQSYSSFGADVMLLYQVREDFQVTAGVCSFGTSVKSQLGDSYSLPASAVLAGNYHAVFARQHGLEVALDVDYFFSGNVTVALGAEYAFRDLLFLRGGYHFGTEAAVLPSFATMGAGVKWAGFRIDASYLTASEFLGNTLTIGLGYSF